MHYRVLYRASGGEAVDVYPETRPVLERQEQVAVGEAAGEEFGSLVLGNPGLRQNVREKQQSKQRIDLSQRARRPVVEKKGLVAVSTVIEDHKKPSVVQEYVTRRKGEVVRERNRAVL